MPRLRPVRAVRALTFEEKNHVANFFMLLIEIDMQKGVTRKRRSPTSAKTKKTSATKKRESQKSQELSLILNVRTKTSRPRSSSRTARRDLCLPSFARIFSCGTITFILEQAHDRHHNLNTH